MNNIATLKPARESEIQSALSRIDKGLSSLSETVGSLETRIGSCLRIEPECETANKDCVEPPTTKLAATLFEDFKRIESITRSLVSLINRIEL